MSIKYVVIIQYYVMLYDTTLFINIFFVIECVATSGNDVLSKINEYLSSTNDW